MAARKKKRRINLLPQEEFAASTLGRIVAWLLSSFRVIVILTEMIVMIAFLSRFWLDAKSADLNELIRQKQAVIASTSDFEKEFRETQYKLEIFSELTSEESMLAEYLESISSYLPPEVALSSFSIVGNQINIEGISSSERGLAQFIANLKTIDHFEEVFLTQISTDQETQILLNFGLRIKAKGGS